MVRTDIQWLRSFSFTAYKASVSIINDPQINKCTTNEPTKRFNILHELSSDAQSMRICFFGGPGSGKSASALKLCAWMKERHYSVDIATEYVKKWAYQKYIPQDFDQLSILSKQQQREEIALRHGVQYVITDSPILLVYAYTMEYFPKIADAVLQISKVYDSMYPSLNIFIKRPITYQQHGRYQSVEQAIDMDNKVLAILDKEAPGYHIVDCGDFDRIISIIECR